MATIIAGRFDEQTDVEAAVKALRNAGFPSDHISSFYVAPAGQHARTPIGGDRDKSPGAATTPLTGPIGAITGGLVGAHVGNLVGALGKMKDDESPYDAPTIRHAGLLVAVSAPNAQCEERAIAVLRAHGAQQLESSAGHIVRGDWEDFDPAAPPQLIDMRQPPGQAGMGA